MGATVRATITDKDTAPISPTAKKREQSHPGSRIVAEQSNGATTSPMTPSAKEHAKAYPRKSSVVTETRGTDDDIVIHRKPATLQEFPIPRQVGANDQEVTAPLHSKRTADGRASQHSRPQGTMAAAIRAAATTGRHKRPTATSLEKTLQDLETSQERDHTIAITVSFLRQWFDSALFFAKKAEGLVNWHSTQTLPKARAKSTATVPGTVIPLGQPSLLREVVTTRLPYRGVIADKGTQALLQTITGNTVDNFLCYPLVIKERVVGILLATGSVDSAVTNENIASLVSATERSLARVVRKRKRTIEGTG